MDSIPLGLTYDDVLLVPRFSSIRSRRDVDVSTRFTRDIALKVPLVSANMDTVTEAPMAIALAEFGGLGVIHRFLPIEDQAAAVSRVKRHQNEIIEDPYTVAPGSTVQDARLMMSDRDVGGLPVVSGDNRLLGIVTRRDVQFGDGHSLVSDHMTPADRLVVAAPDVTLDEAREAMTRRRVEKLPLVDGQGRLVGLMTARDLARDPALSEATRDSKGRLRVAAAVGVVGDFLERAQTLVGVGADALVIDIAHGDSAPMLEAVRRLREVVGAVSLVAGNVATAEGTERLIDVGADAVKVGVGPGSVCITREVAGVGMPQLTAVMQSAEVAHGHGVPVIADGGIRRPGDVAKAMGAGASTVMLGRLLAGTDQSPGFIIMRDGSKMKVVRGMASTEATVERSRRDGAAGGPVSNGETGDSHTAAEGVQTLVRYRGGVQDVLSEIVAGLRSGMSYCDAADMRQMWENAHFVRQTQAGIRESGAWAEGGY